MKQEQIFIYGKHSVSEAFKHKPEAVVRVYFSHEFDDVELRKETKKRGIPSELFTDKKMPGGLRKDATHQGVIACLSGSAIMTPYHDFISEINITPSTSVVILGEVQDPHNVGAVIRSAAAFGVSGVLIPPHNQAPVTGTVVKVSAGMAFTVPLVTISNVNSVARDLKDRGFWVYGLAGEGDTSLYDEVFSKPTAFILGNEATGLREKTREVCDNLVHIPMHPRAESLNASASAATVFSHWSKQHQDALS